jgi:O-antigen ligase
MVALFGWFLVTIPFSSWRGGSFAVVCFGLSKVLIIAIAAIAAVNTLHRLRRLMLVHTLGMLTMASVAFGQSRVFGRMYGAGTMFVDPNDLALNLCVVLPFCVAMLLSTRNPVGRLFWTGATLIAFAAIVATFSRGGFLAFIAVMLGLALRFRFAAWKTLAFAMVAAVGITTVLLAVGPYSYFDRMQTILNPVQDQTGSALARSALLISSLQLTAEHPLLGVGPGQFETASGLWQLTHNTYTQLSAEAGIPALLLFLALLWQTFRNLRRSGERQSRIQGYIADALYCGMLGYVVGAFFLSTAFWLTPYLLVAYAAAMRRICEITPT